MPLKVSVTFRHMIETWRWAVLTPNNVKRPHSYLGTWRWVILIEGRDPKGS